MTSLTLRLGNRAWPLGPLSVSGKAALRHRHMMGITGMGKSKCIASLVVQILAQGGACAVLDPHSDLVDDILQMLIDQRYFAHPQAYERLLYIDYSHPTRFLPFNVLNQPGVEPHKIARDLLEVCERAWTALDGGNAPAFENLMLAGTMVLVENHLPLTMLPRMLQDAAFRESLLDNVSDSQVVDFFRLRYKHGSQVNESTLRRVFLLTYSPAMRFSLGQLENRLPLRALMDKGVSLLVNLGGLDEDTQRFLGALLTVSFEVAALSRADIPEEARRPYHLVLDEFSMFSAQSAVALERVLALTRKYALTLTLANQTWGQFDKRLQSALQNCLPIFFRLGFDDAGWAAPRMLNYNPKKIKHSATGTPSFVGSSEQTTELERLLQSMKPQQAIVRVDTKAEMIRTLTLPAARCTKRQLQAVKDSYAARLLAPPLDERTLRPPVRSGEAKKPAASPGNAPPLFRRKVAWPPEEP